MGLVLGAVALVTTSISRDQGKRGVPQARRWPAVAWHGVGKCAMGAAVLGLLLWTGQAVLPNFVTDYLAQRFAEAQPVTEMIAGGMVPVYAERNPTSTEARTALLLAAVEIAHEHWPAGAGPYQSERLMEDRIGLFNVAHNVYLEWIISGGVVGLLPPLVFLAYLRRGWRRGRPEEKSRTSFLLALAVILAVAGCFLSLTYNSLIWLPVVIAEAICRQRPHVLLRVTWQQHTAEASRSKPWIKARQMAGRGSR